MKLSFLVESLSGLLVAKHVVPGQEETEIRKVTSSVWQVETGTLFVAVKGFSFDGGTLCCEAVKRGASAIVSETDGQGNIPWFTVRDSREALAFLCAACCGRPADSMTLIGVTGTNGKTTVASMIEHILSSCGKTTGIVGTVENKVGKTSFYSGFTTPEPETLHRMFADMRQVGTEYAVMEVSSHAADQRRVSGISFEVGVFTNLTEDHLDYHRTMENYKNAKLSFIRQCRAGILNKDSVYYDDFAKNCTGYSYSLRDRNASFYACNIMTGTNARNAVDSVFDIVAFGTAFPVRMKIPGIFNIYNAVAAFGACSVLGIEPEQISAALSSFKGVRGRMELVEAGTPYKIIIDFAHTPDGLLNLLSAAREFTSGKIIVVFGCGGDRDRFKRPVMGQIAEKYADWKIVTSDNPRTEEPEAILNDIVAGMKKEDGLFVIEDRREAIRKALSLAEEGDTVLIAGKGHEEYQTIGLEKYPFNERAIIWDLLK